MNEATLSRLAGCAQRWQDGVSASVAIEDELDQVLPDIESIGTDYYDNSIEIYVEKPHDQHGGMTKAAVDVCKAAGFDRGWLNFNDGHEQAFNCHLGHIEPVRKKSY